MPLYRNNRSRAQRLRRKKELLAELKQFYSQQFTHESIGHLSQDVTSIDSVPVIKTEILDPSEQNQEFILPDYLQHVTTIDPMWIVETEIQDSSKANKLLLPNIKVEQIENDSALDTSSRTEFLSESFINSEIENSLIFKCKLTKCSVLLHDCLIPENLTSILAKFKSLRINTDISEVFPKVSLFPLSDAPFLPHISEAYKKMASSKMEKKSKPNHEARPNNIKKKKSYYERSKKYICNCFKASEDAMISMGSQFYENYFESTQQLCSCLSSDNMLSESTEILVKKASLFDPDFGKITCGMNKMEYNF
ncbi:hypothetical protein AVEN_256382-1 [Araneus ventricosus]|uniref:Uncharacterized protein n=1 Tax=Araneus ventricosus TaxID=182803 RepID=A0A4Y2MGB3_ARAVE|nr:hypothetical protein AVEN_256382-1 [Araneus ventricosus]